MKKNKTYVGIMRLHEDINEDDLKEKMKDFVGKMTQRPPVRSSVKRAEREREVYVFKLLEKEGKDVLFEAHVEAGTYIRTIVHDLGKKIGDAHMLELRRIAAGIFGEEESISLYDFDKAVDAYDLGNESLLRKMIVSSEEVIKKVLPIIEIKKDNLDKIFTGKPIHDNDLKKEINIEKGEHTAVFCEGKFIEIARVV